MSIREADGTWHAAREDDGTWHAAREDWKVLLERCSRILAESAQVRGVARQARSQAVEHRLSSKNAQLVRDNTAGGQYH